MKVAAVAVSSKEELLGKVDENAARFKVPAVEPIKLSMVVLSSLRMASPVRICVRPCITLPKPMPEPSMVKLLPVSTWVSL